MFNVQEQEERDHVHTPIIDVAVDLARRSHADILTAEDGLIREALSKGLVVVTSDYIITTELDTFVNLGQCFEKAFYLRAEAEEYISGQESIHEEFDDWPIVGYHILMPEERCP